MAQLSSPPASTGNQLSTGTITFKPGFIEFPQDVDLSTSVDASTVLFCPTCHRHVVVLGRTFLLPDLYLPYMDRRDATKPSLHLVICFLCQERGEALDVVENDPPTEDTAAALAEESCLYWWAEESRLLRCDYTDQTSLFTRRFATRLQPLITALGFPASTDFNMDALPFLFTEDTNESPMYPRFYPWPLLANAQREAGTRHTPKLRFKSFDAHGLEVKLPKRFLWPVDELPSVRGNLYWSDAMTYWALFCGNCLRSLIMKTTLAFEPPAELPRHPDPDADRLTTLFTCCRRCLCSAEATYERVANICLNGIGGHRRMLQTIVNKAFWELQWVRPVAHRRILANPVRGGQRFRIIVPEPNPDIVVWDAWQVAATILPTARAYGQDRGHVSEGVPEGFL